MNETNPYILQKSAIVKTASKDSQLSGAGCNPSFLRELIPAYRSFCVLTVQ